MSCMGHLYSIFFSLLFSTLFKYISVKCRLRHLFKNSLLHHQDLNVNILKYEQMFEYLNDAAKQNKKTVFVYKLRLLKIFLVCPQLYNPMQTFTNKILMVEHLSTSNVVIDIVIGSLCISL